MSLWLALKRFQTTWVKVKLIIGILAVVVADFMVLSMLVQGWGAVITAASILILTIVALSATMLHLADRVDYDLGVYKALGATRETITLSFMIELFLTGLLGALLGLLVGVSLLVLLPALLPLKGWSLLTLAEALGFALLFSLLGIFTGAALGAYSVWKKSHRMTAEIFAHVE
ncbi:FtsX-like permease family protein [Candidatus Hecatella orcuttiae]|jgi:predicted lysophospholipase L1 biosynthesis ABC-type transport system permease subunit|uniref:FtsX-like permease family protein n=1 Tax=Candidatus Hecatella orcuttiae TaxID=1935119 RepID=UPI002867F1C8|nr:FtsX-like permease family protein [Candidatus Hecatella orcuttiae]